MNRSFSVVCACEDVRVTLLEYVQSVVSGGAVSIAWHETDGMQIGWGGGEYLGGGNISFTDPTPSGSHI